MSAGVVIRVPEQTAVIQQLVMIGMVSIDVPGMICHLSHHVEPATISTAEKLNSKSQRAIVLVVVVRNHWFVTASDKRLRDPRRCHRSFASQTDRWPPTS